MSNVDKSLYSLNDVFKRLGEDNIWVELSSLAKENKAVDLSQGYPDYDSLRYLNQIIQKTLDEDKFQLQQYTRSLVNKQSYYQL
jgi:hypothetical protein